MPRRGAAPRRSGPREWVGGILQLPIVITDDGPAYHPSLVVWLELDDLPILKGGMFHPREAPAALLRLFGEALETPAVGPPRRPDRARLEQADIARKLEAKYGIATTVAPTPELAVIAESMAEFEAQRQPEHDALEETTYLPEGISPSMVASLFARAKQLFKTVPWKEATDAATFAVDCPLLGVRGGLLSLIGALGQSRGLLLFESAPAFQSFIRSAEEAQGDGRLPDADTVDFGGEVLSLTFEAKGDLPPRLRQEIAQHGWPIAGKDAYPVIQRRDRTGMPLPTTAIDLRLADALAEALGTFMIEHGDRFGDPDCDVTIESRSETGGHLRLQYPHPLDLHDDTLTMSTSTPTSDRTTDGPDIGRNAPCPCGSGHKYKRCCLRKDEEARDASSARPPGPGASFDAEVIRRMLDYALTRFPDAAEAAEDIFVFDEEHADLYLQLFVPWLAYSYRIDGREPLAAHYLRARGHNLAAKERIWIEQHLRARLSVWEVEEVRRGEGVTILDLLTGERRVVVERMGSQTLLLREGLLARVAREGTVDRFHGLYPRSLPPRETLAVVKAMSARAGWPALPVTPEVVSASDADHALIGLWQEEVDRQMHAPAPELRNTDGDVLVLVEDTYGLDQRRPADVVTALAAAGFERERDENGAARFRLIKRKRSGALETVLAATIIVHGDRLVVEANSRKRATAAKKKIEAALGGPELRRRHRSESTPEPPLGPVPSGPVRAEVSSGHAEIPVEEAHRMVKHLKAEHWKRWIDGPMDALGGATPRQAARLSETRAEVDLLLKEAERLESASEPAARYDVAQIRRELGLG